MPRAIFNMTFDELGQLFGNLNQVLAALQNAAENGQNDLPTIRIDD